VVTPPVGRDGEAEARVRQLAVQRVRAAIVLDCSTPPTRVAVRWMSVALSVNRLERAL
jgi:hypothetical protein